MPFAVGRLQPHHLVAAVQSDMETFAFGRNQTLRDNNTIPHDWENLRALQNVARISFFVQVPFRSKPSISMFSTFSGPAERTHTCPAFPTVAPSAGSYFELACTSHNLVSTPLHPRPPRPVLALARLTVARPRARPTPRPLVPLDLNMGAFL